MLGASINDSSLRNLSYYEKADTHLVSRIWHGNIVDLVRDLMPLNFQQLRHLDIGCGDGVKIRRIKPGGEILGVDIDERMLAAARQNDITTIMASAEDLSMFQDGRFEIITCLDVLEHVEHPTLVLSEICRLLVKRGFLIITTPNAGRLFRFLWAAWTSLGPGKYWRGSPHVHTYNLWKPTASGMSLVDRLRDVGLKPERTANTNFGMLVCVRAVKV